MLYCMLYHMLYSMLYSMLYAILYACCTYTTQKPNWRNIVAFDATVCPKHNRKGY